MGDTSECKDIFKERMEDARDTVAYDTFDLQHDLALMQTGKSTKYDNFLIGLYMGILSSRNAPLPINFEFKLVNGKHKLFYDLENSKE